MASTKRSILDLPSDALFSVFSFLPANDLAVARMVCPAFKEVIDCSRNSALWTYAPFVDLWPSPENIHIFQKAGNYRNVEAMIKLAVAYLYCEGVPECAGKGTLDSVNGAKATEWLQKAEECSQDVQPFSWVLIRPPWSPHGICCKACVHLKYKELVDSGKDCTSRYAYLVGKTLSFSEDEQRNDAITYYQIGMTQQCPYATFEYLKHYNPNMRFLDIQSMRLLRQTASLSNPSQCWEAQIALCQAYAAGNYGGISETAALNYVQNIMMRSRSCHDGKLHSGINANMRYILIDWLFEVLEMKEFPSTTIHLAVNLVDCYLQQRPVSRSKLQLLGISSMLLAARWMGVQIITIREAAWLTDNTYKYEEVVQMMGEMFAVFRGDIRKQTVVDYVEILLKFAQGNNLTRSMALYFSEFTLLHTDLLTYQPSHLASSIVLLSKVIAEENALTPWPALLERITGFSVSKLSDLCIKLHQKCFVDKWTVKDHRNVELKAIVQRFSDQRFMAVSKMNVLTLEEVKEALGFCEIEEEPLEHDRTNVPHFPPDTISVENLSLSEVEYEKENSLCPSQGCMESVTDESRQHTPGNSMDCSISISPSILPSRDLSHVQCITKENQGKGKGNFSPQLRAPLQLITNHMKANNREARKGNRTNCLEASHRN